VVIVLNRGNCRSNGVWLTLVLVLKLGSAAGAEGGRREPAVLTMRSVVNWTSHTYKTYYREEKRSSTGNAALDDVMAKR